MVLIIAESAGAAEQGFYPGDELDGTERFVDVVVRSRFQHHRPVDVVLPLDKDEQGDVGKLADFADEFQGVRIGEGRVHHDEVGRFGFNFL